MSTNKLPIFSIVGTTSTGKSEAVFLLSEYALEKKVAPSVVIISADSRQVYSGLEVLTGADLPENFIVGENNFEFSTLASESGEKIPQKYFYKAIEQGEIELYGLSIVSPFVEWSVGRFNQYARTIIAAAKAESKLIFVVGGTGLYHQHVDTTDPRLCIPPNLRLREKLGQLSVTQLQEELRRVNGSYFAQLNNSDKNNPRRLQRAIEVEQALQLLKQTDPETFDTFLEQRQAAQQPRQTTHTQSYVGLQISSEELHKKIAKRVQDRFSGGAVDEVRALLALSQATNRQLSPQVTSTLGFAEITQFLDKKITADACIEQWIQADYQYSKRQLTWWKKYPAVQWINREGRDWYNNLQQVFVQQITQY